MSKATCSIEGCDRPKKARGWCQSHYMRWYERGEVGTGPIRAWDSTRTCQVQGCENKYAELGYCAAHSKRVAKYGEPGPAKIRPRVTPDDEASYSLAHMRLKLKRGPARRHACVDCEGPALHWSYDHQCPNEMVDPEKGLAFSIDLSHYVPRCVPCHVAFDRGRNKVIDFSN